MFWTEQKFNQVIAERRAGLYDNKDTQEDCLMAYRSLDDKDRIFGLIRSAGQFAKYNEAEVEDLITFWRKRKVTIQEYNIIELELMDGTKFWCFVVQPPEKDLKNCSLDPVGIAHGLMVTGYCYFAKNKSICDYIRNAVMRGRKIARQSK